MNFMLVHFECILVDSMEDPSKAFLLFFLLPDQLKLNHLKSRTECGFSDIFSRHICSTVAETIGVTNYAPCFGAKNVQKTTFEAAEMMLGPWNQQIPDFWPDLNFPLEHVIKVVLIGQHILFQLQFKNKNYGNATNFQIK